MKLLLVGLGAAGTFMRVLTASLVLATCPMAAHAAPKYLRLSFTGDTSTTMTATWTTDAQEDTNVRYGTSTGKYTGTVAGTSFQANSGLGYIHDATITDLQPDTVYYYVAGSASKGWSAEHSFRTGPVEDESCGSFKFTHLGDNRPDPTFGGGQNWAQILDQAAAHDPEFVLNGGDLVTDGDNISGWKDFLGWTEKVASTAAFMPCIGNHDDGPGEGDTANYNQLFTLPRSGGANGSGTEDYYYFTYANAVFVSLSTEGFAGGSVPFGKQAAWLDEVLTNNPRKWKFVFFHKPIYTNQVIFDISHPPDEEGQNAAWVTVFDKHHVDMVFTSHNHWYERYEPSACATQGKPGSDDPCPVGATGYDKGTVYVVSGGAGAFTIPGILCGIQTGRPKCSGNHHYVMITINNETLKYETWSAYPQANQVIDTITITKTADSCTVPVDAGVPDAGTDSGGFDASADASLDASKDAGAADAGKDGGKTPDAASDASTDGAAPPDAADPPDGTEADGGQAGEDAGAPILDDSGNADGGAPGDAGGWGGDDGDQTQAAGCACNTL